MDQGGTFTDVVTVDASGTWRVRKVPSDHADLHALAEGAADVRRGTTVATNALLERSFEPVVLLTHPGFTDAVDFGDQVRPELFARTVRRTRPLAPLVVPLPGRLGPDGSVEAAFALDELASLLPADVAHRPLAVVTPHGPRAPDQVAKVADHCRSLGASHVTTGPEVAPTAGFFDRMRTTVLDAALTPLLPRMAGWWMCSDGGLAGHDSPEWRGSRAVLSGPAGGVVSTAAHARRTGRACGFIGLDMGGTSSDVCRVAPGGQVATVDQLEVDGLVLATPSVRVDTIAAGGGSVLGAQGGVFTVGPQSAGSTPGPACYGRGGPLALTDVEAILGRLPDFPPIAGPARDAPLDVQASVDRMLEFAGDQPVEAVAAGFRRVAHSRMAGAVRRIAAEDAANPADHILVAFGGAGPAHACGVARELGIREVHVPVLAGVWSAVGIGMARSRVERREAVQGSVVEAVARARAAAKETGTETLTLMARPVGTMGLLELPLTLAEAHRADAAGRVERSVSGVTRLLLEGDLRAAFDTEHKRLHGFVRPELAVEAVAVRVVVEGDAPHLPPVVVAAPKGEGNTARAWFDGRWRAVPLVRHGSTDVLDLTGPALVLLPGATVVVDAGWTARSAGDHLVLVDRSAHEVPSTTERHPVHTAVFGARLAGTAEAMGETLARLARSVSIRERRDFSCAVFDRDGRLAVNAPHVPVHLGAMGETVRTLLHRRRDTLQPGQVWVTNDPYAGGSHLPDITVMRPVFTKSGDLLAFVACRGHHVDVGGIRPGSMPPDARTIDEEGVVIGLALLVDALGEVHLPPLPGCRQPHDVAADLLAQAAACAVGARGVEALVTELGPAGVRAQLGHLQAVAADAVCEALRGRDGRVAAMEVFDDGTPLRVNVELTEDGARVHVHIDAPAHPGNLNAPGAVARAAVLYVLRCLVGTPVPLNEGVLDRVRITVNPGGLFDPGPPRAVAGGNVETSQRLVDALFVALGAGAAGQGTMNNLTVGTPAGAFYETIGGGAGATDEGPGASAVQVHMTNTRATDVEALERRFPVRVERWARRWNSGGAGRHRGGDGITKVWRFLAPSEVALLAGRRTAGAPGLAGGGAGAPGRDLWKRGDRWQAAPSVFQAQPGDLLRIDTPGGGGFGPTDD